MIKPKRFYGKGIPGVNLEQLHGQLIVVEGADGSGRSTQMNLLRNWLERLGFPTVNVGLKRSMLVSRELESAMRGNILGTRTLSLFYATDFADQLENKIIPALRSGYIVLADRYIYTLMSRDAVRGISTRWSHNLFGFVMKPHLVFYLEVDPNELVHRVFQKNSSLDYYESGADLGLSDNMFESFLIYQGLLAKQFRKLQKKYGLVP